MITIFKDGIDIANPHYITVDHALSRIANGASKDAVLKIREVKKSGGSTSSLKLKLPSVIFSGKCTKEIEKVYKTGKNKGKKYKSKRDDESVTEHSSYFVLDFDHVDVESKKQQLKNDEYIYACWTSPSGDGIKALVKCPPSIEKHTKYYESFVSRYPELDTTSKNIARLCYESYDPEIFIRAVSKEWSKQLSPEATVRVTQTRTEQHNNRIMDVAAGMIRSAVDGTKHDTLIKAAKLCGGYIAVGRLDEMQAKQTLLDEISARDIDDVNGAEKAIDDGIEYGKRRPIQEAKKLEKAQTFIKRKDGNYDFLADEKEMDWYEESFLNGTLPMGLPTGLNQLDKYWMFKHNTLVWFMGLDNTGKSFIMWYLAVLQAMLNGKKFLLYSAENGDGEVRKKLKEMYIGERLDNSTEEQIAKASEFTKNHFKIMTSKKMHTVEEFLMRAEIVFDEGWEFDCVIGDPFNGFDVPLELSGHIHNVKALNMLRVFKENYSSIWMTDHAGSFAARDMDNDGYVRVPWKSSVDGGQIKANKTDDFIVVHRLTNHPTDWMITEVHVQKIKSTETGGGMTAKGNPFRMVMNMNKCGYHQMDSFDPVKKYWQYKGKTETPKQAIDKVNDSLKANTSFDEPTPIIDDIEIQSPF